MSEHNALLQLASSCCVDMWCQIGHGNVELRTQSKQARSAEFDIFTRRPFPSPIRVASYRTMAASPQQHRRSNLCCTSKRMDGLFAHRCPSVDGRVRRPCVTSKPSERSSPRSLPNQAGIGLVYPTRSLRRNDCSSALFTIPNISSFPPLTPFMGGFPLSLTL